MAFRGMLAGAALLLGVGVAAHAAPRLDTFSTNLDPLIDRAARKPAQFAVDVARRVTDADGQWHLEGKDAVWEYALRIPGAVTLSFHASQLLLPAGGSVAVAGGGRRFDYPAASIHRSELWSRPVPGDTLSITLRVPSDAQRRAHLDIPVFQAGYRALGSGLADHPHFRSIKAQTAAAAGSCVENYQCDASSGTQDAASASVALIISNNYECSGTLLNDVPHDGTPYVLTARHCQNGDDGGGAPQAAASVTVYWNASTPCGQTPGSIFDGGTQVQSGASTVVEQQDQWLIRLLDPPAADNAVFAGWDASGAAVSGGFTIHYALATDQQYTGWNGVAITQNVSGSTLGLGYDSVFLGTVNALGSVDHGASGSGLFTTDNRLVGSLSRAVVAQCPATPPPQPSGASATAFFSKLAATWNATADTTSTTGSVTLAAVLDPAHTGTLSTDAHALPPTATLVTAQASAQAGSAVQLSWQVSAGATCTASGGSSGDGWSGAPIAVPRGGLTVSSAQVGTFTYTLTCARGPQSVSAATQVTWTAAPPAVTFSYQSSFAYPGVAVSLVWQSNQGSCTPGGGRTGDGWSGSLAGSGQKAVTESQPGSVTYTISCGSGAQQASQSVIVYYQAPLAALHLEQAPAGLRFGSRILLVYAGTGECTMSGGGAGDGWSGSFTGGGGQQFLSLTESQAGSFTYTLTCGPAGIAVSDQVSYVFSNAPPAATLTAAHTSYVLDLTQENLPDLLSWSANLTPCGIHYDGPVSGDAISFYGSTGSYELAPQIAGRYTYTLTCGQGAASATSTVAIDFTQPTPHVTLSASGGGQYIASGRLVYSTNVLPCTGSGGTPNDNWNGGVQFYASIPGGTNSTTVYESQPGSYTYTLTCGSGATATASATAVYVQAGGAALTFAAPANNSFSGGTFGNVSVYYGAQPAHLTWSSQVSPCTGYDDTGVQDSWSAAQPVQGALEVPIATGDYVFTLICGTGTTAIGAQVAVASRPADSDLKVSFDAGNPARAPVGHARPLSWTSIEGVSCVPTGGNPGDGWSGQLPSIGAVSVTETGIGTVQYGLTCQNGPTATAPATWSLQWVADPAVTLTSSTAQATFGTPLNLTWAATDGARNCSATEDTGTSATWSGVLPGSSGSVPVTETDGATHTYHLTCASEFGTRTAQVVVSFSAPAGGSDGSGGGTGTGGGTGGGDTSGSGSTGGSAGGSAPPAGSGGGGTLDPAWLALLVLVVGGRGGRLRRLGH